MTTIMRYDPFREALSLRNALNQLFEQSFVQPTWGSGLVQGVGVPMNVYETEHGYQIQALLPGVKPEHIDLSVQENTLTIKGQLSEAIKPEQQVTWLLQEIGPGYFERSIVLPKGIDADQITTSYEYGVLSVTVPFSQATRPRKISITGSTPKQMTVEAGAR